MKHLIFLLVAVAPLGGCADPAPAPDPRPAAPPALVYRKPDDRYAKALERQARAAELAAEAQDRQAQAQERAAERQEQAAERMARAQEQAAAAQEKAAEAQEDAAQAAHDQRGLVLEPPARRTYAAAHCDRQRSLPQINLKTAVSQQRWRSEEHFQGLFLAERHERRH